MGIRIPILAALVLCLVKVVLGGEKGTCRVEEQDCEMVTKSIISVMPATRPHWVGNGFHVYPVFSNLAFTEALSPFLMLDYAAPKHFDPSPIKRGVGQHPHRGFETVTIAFEGEVEHADSMGNKDVIGTGDLQWMTAGRGIIHEEFHSTRFREQGGMFEMIQLWVNLPKEKKMTAPSYQPILAKSIPEVPLPESSGAGHVRVIAGSYLDTKGPASTHTPMLIWDVSMKEAGKEWAFDVPDGFNTMIFLRKGSITIAGKQVGPQGMVRLDTSGTRVMLRSEEADTKIMLLAGEPIAEPIAARGPFVMNTWDEIQKANEDFYSGNFGT